MPRTYTSLTLEDGKRMLSAAEAKAASLGIPHCVAVQTTSDLATPVQSGKPLFGIQESNAGKVVIFGGGVPVVLDGTIVGAVGASARTVEQDIAVAEAAIAALGRQARSSDDLNRKTAP